MAKTNKKSELPPITDPQLVKVNLCIPPLGTRIVLAEPWTFDLFYERRNEKLIETLGIRKWVEGPIEKRTGTRNVWGSLDRNNRWVQETYEYDHTPAWWEWQEGIDSKISSGDFIKKITLPRGSKLTVMRIYIRCGGPAIRAYNSVTFSLIKAKTKKGEPKAPHGRFWAKLYDVNRIVCYPVGSDPDVDALWNKPEATHLRTFKFLDINDPLD